MARTRFAELRRIARVGGGGFFRIEDALTQAASLELDALSPEVDALAELQQQDERKMANDGALVVWLMLPLALLLFRRNALWILVPRALFRNPRTSPPLAMPLMPFSRAICGSPHREMNLKPLRKKRNLLVKSRA